MSNKVYFDPSDLTKAIVAKVDHRVMMVPTIQEQLNALVRPGHAVAFRTESGSLYDLSVYSDKTVKLYKVDQESDRLKLVAQGVLTGAHDRERNVFGMVVTDSQQREYKTSAVVKVWLTYDATTNQCFGEPE